MKAIVISKPNEIEIRQVDEPIVKEGEALLKILYVGICGADVASFTGNQPFTTYPRIPGHEFSAQVISVPENDKGIKEGDIVTCNPYFNCGSCYSCRRGYVNCCIDNQTMGVQRDGAFCEYVSMPLDRIYNGEGLSPKELALIEPFSISQHAVSRGEIKDSDNVLIVGAGPIGLFSLIAARQKAGRIVVADILDNRLELATGIVMADSECYEVHEDRESFFTERKPSDRSITREEYYDKMEIMETVTVPMELMLF